MTRLELLLFGPAMVIRHLIEWMTVHAGFGRAVEPRLRRRLDRTDLRFARLERLWAYEKLQDAAERRGDWPAVQALIEQQAADVSLKEWAASTYVAAAERAFDAGRLGDAADYLRQATAHPVKNEADRKFLAKSVQDLRVRLASRAGPEPSGRN